MNILFICRHNRFRSKVAEALFKKYNKDKAIKVLSAGTNPDYLPVSKTVKRALRKLGVYRVNPRPQNLTKKLLKWADLIVVTADDAKLRNKSKKILRWEISDTTQGNYKGVLIRSKIIREKVKKLVRKLG